jgi:pantoate--beta-alanine ligase
MLEIEQKYAGADFDGLAAALQHLGATGPEVHVEADQYFNAPDRDFARTGEAFRLRRVGARNYFTYKGPKRQGAAVKVRTELEIALPDGDAAAREHAELLGCLGYRAVAVVRKTRSSYHLRREGLSATVCLDEVDELGRFAEVEVLAAEDQAGAVQDALQRLAAELGLSRVEPHSYLHLLLQKRAAGPHPGKAPRVATSPAELRQALAEARRQGQTVGLVPTMGALHEGHESLMAAARARNDVVVVTVFVNPTQFGPGEDLDRYPRPFADDVRRCAAAGVDLVYHPKPAVTYPPPYRTFVEVTELSGVLEGASRPGHFRGVATVVLKLFNLVRPDRAYFGQKDAQQVRVVQQMVRDLDVPVEVVVCPTVREPDGLALSSRNRYLDGEQRRAAVVLSRALDEAAGQSRAGLRDADALCRLVRERVGAAPGAVLDYVAAVDAESLTPVAVVDRPVLLALAVRFGPTRLIDNHVLGEDER